LDPQIEERCERQRQEFARRHIRRQHAFTLIWPLIARRLDARPNMNATELFEELRAQYPGRFHPGQRATLTNHVRRWREDARARGVEIGRIHYRQSSTPRTRRRPDPFEKHWPEMLPCLAADPDQTGRELFNTFTAKYPGYYTPGQLRTVQRRLKIWRRDAVQQLICEMKEFTQDVGAGTS